jgi:hypothetical protein
MVFEMVFYATKKTRSKARALNFVQILSLIPLLSRNLNLLFVSISISSLRIKKNKIRKFFSINESKNYKLYNFFSTLNLF